MAQNWHLRIWGTRGSVPVSGLQHVRHGGRTTCLELDLGHARILVDAGSGLAEFGRRHATDLKPTLLLMTHLHWDHVLGFPHCGAIYMPGWTLDVRGVPRQGVTVLDALFDLNRPPLFPVDLRTGSGVKYVHTALEEQGNTHFHGVEIDWMPVEHPGGCTAFRFSLGGRRIVFTGDVELARTDQQALGAFSQGADVLLIDSQYTADEYPNHVGWGHSTNLDAAEFALRSGARRLLLTHHDPRHDDDDLDVMEAQARSIFTGAQAAADGMVVSSDDLP